MTASRHRDDEHEGHQQSRDAHDQVSAKRAPELQSPRWRTGRPHRTVKGVERWLGRSSRAPDAARLRRAAAPGASLHAPERGGHTLQTTALVNEAYIRLVDARGIDWQDRTHFLSVCAQIMRRVLVDAARRRASAKRGGPLAHAERSSAIDLDQLAAPGSDRAAEVCALDDALKQLAKMDPRRAQVIELRFFGGLTVEETAAALKISPQSVMRDWKLARAWLARELRR